MCIFLQGRNKRGSIFVFAAGNGGVLAKDSCAYNGYVNSIYTIAISSVNRDGSVPYYGERCPGIMAVAYSRDSFGDKNPVVSQDFNLENTASSLRDKQNSLTYGIQNYCRFHFGCAFTYPTS